MTPRTPVLRINRTASRPKVEVLSEGGKFVVQEIPLTGIAVEFDPHGPGTVTMTMRADLLSIQDPA